MQTIILTDNKRLSTDYHADKTIFAEKIDVNHILNTQVYQSHISRARFWIIRTNVYNEENLVHELCKNLVNRGSTAISFEFSVMKIAVGQELAYVDERKPNENKYGRSSRVSGYLTPSALKTLQFPQFMNMTSKQQNTHTKTTSSVEWSQLHPTETHDQTARRHHPQPDQQSCHHPPCTKDEQQVTLKPLLKKQFQISSLNELSAVFMSKEGIFNQFGMNEDVVMRSKRMVVSYVFRQNDVEIGLSVVSEGSRKYLEKAVNIEISQAFNIQFNSRKQAYQSTCLTQNFSSTTIPNPKSTTKLLSHDVPKQTYHKILLFLFTHYDPDSSSSSSKLPTSPQQNSPSNNRFIQAVQQWKMRDQDINITQKLSKEYVLIKQEVENEKVSFKNKLKVFEAIIGESVNVEKLLNEEKEMSQVGMMGMNGNLLGNNGNGQIGSGGALNDINSRVSRKSELRSMLNSPQQLNSSSSNSQFKRLKESFEMIRNIDNIITEQSKKIQTLRQYLKQLSKSKNQTLYKHARTSNQIKKQIRQVQSQIEQRKKEYEVKNARLLEDDNENKRSFVPTVEAKQVLEGNVRVFRRIMGNERTNKNNQRYLIEEEDVKEDMKENKEGGSCLVKGNRANNRGTISGNSNSNGNNKENNCSSGNNSSGYNDRNTINTVNTTTQKGQHLNNNFTTLGDPSKKPFMIRKQQPKSIYSSTTPLNNTTCSTSILTTITQTHTLTQTRLMRRRQQQVQNHNIWLSIHEEKSRKSEYEERSEELSNYREMEVLMGLWVYYQRNRVLLEEVGRELGGGSNKKDQRKDDKGKGDIKKGERDVKGNLTIGSNGGNKSQLFNRTTMMSNNTTNNSNNNNNSNTNNNNTNNPNNSRTIHSCLHPTRPIPTTSSSQLNLHLSPFTMPPPIDLTTLPILNQALNPRTFQSAFQSEECSLISDSVLEGNQEERRGDGGRKGDGVKGSQKKRVTLEGLVGKVG